MVSYYSLAVSKVICIDLLNASKEDLHNYFIISNTPEVLKLYLNHLHAKLHDDLFDSSNPHLIFIDENYIVGTKRYEHSIQKMALGHTEILPDTSVDNLDKSIFPLMENILLKNKNLQFTEDLALIFKNHFKELLNTEKYCTHFIDAHIQVCSGLALSFHDFCRKYNFTIEFLDCVNKPDTTHFSLHKIYFKNQLPIIFVFKTLEGLEFMGWNKEYLVALHNVSPVNQIPIDNTITLNIILDKINKSGLSSLNNDEFSFLDAYSNF